MALVVKDRVRETSTTTGTGTLTLAGAVSGFQTFSSAIGNANTTYYTITNGSEWEVGLGTVAAGTLARTTILASSNAGSAVTFSAGTKDVFCTYPAGKAIYTDSSGNAIGLGTVAATTTLTNATGLPISTGVSGLGTNVATALGTAVGSSGAIVTNGGVLGTPSSGTLTNCTGLPATGGGTGQSTYAVGDLLQGAATNTLAKLAAVATGNALISGGVTTASSWGKIGLTTHVSGTLPIANGGTNSTTASGGLNNLFSYTTTATSASPVALTNTSTYIQYFTGTVAQTVTLPLNTTIQNGWSFHICNNSTASMTVNSNSGALVVTILAGTTAHITCIDATVNTAAAWDSGLTDFVAASGSQSGYLTSTDWTTFNGKGAGTVTSASVVSANGFAGTVATSTSTPAITISTSITGMLKGNGTAISAGTAGTDYVAPATATNFTAQQYFGASTLTDGATISWAVGAAQVATVTIAGNRTFGAPTGLVSGAFYSLNVIQDATGSRTITWNAVFKWTGGTAPTLSTAASAKDFFVFRSDGTNLYEQGRSLGVA